MSEPTVVVVSPVPPNSNGGNQRRVLQHIDVLSSQYRTIVIYQSARSVIVRNCSINTQRKVKSSSWGETLEGLRLLCTNLPFFVKINYNPSLAVAIRAVVDEYEVDAALFHTITVGPAVRENVADIPVVLDVQDCLSLRFSEKADWASSITSHMKYKIESGLTKKYERRLIRAVDEVIVTTEYDKRALPGGRKAKVVGNYIGRNEEGGGAAQKEFPGRHVVFVGDMGGDANRWGVEWFLREVLPVAEKSVNSLEVVVIGKGAPKSVRQFDAEDNVSVVGYVENLEQWYSWAAVAVAPLPFGTGIKNKVIEALTRGVPVVGTAPSAQGLERIAAHNQGLLIEDDAESFAIQLSRVVSDKELWYEMSRRAQQAGKTLPTQKGVMHKMKDIIEPLMAV